MLQLTTIFMWLTTWFIIFVNIEKETLFGEKTKGIYISCIFFQMALFKTGVYMYMYMYNYVLYVYVYV